MIEDLERKHRRREGVWLVVAYAGLIITGTWITMWLVNHWVMP